MINSLPFFLWVKSGNISRKFLTFILKIFDKNFERLQYDVDFIYAKVEVTVQDGVITNQGKGGCDDYDEFV